MSDTAATVPTALDFPDCRACQMWKDAGASWPRPCKAHYGGEPGVLTFPQRRALGELLRATTGRDAKSIYTRSDVLWRLEERGLVARNLHNEWRITPDGERAYTAYWEARDGT